MHLIGRKSLFASLALILINSSAIAADKITPKGAEEAVLALEPARELSVWFPKLVASFDTFVDSEVKKQFIRKIRYLARRIQGLENRKIEFNAFLEVADTIPKEEFFKEIEQYELELVKWLEETRTAMEDLAEFLTGSVGNEGRETARKLNEMLGTRDSQKYILMATLKSGDTNIKRLRDKNLEGLKALQEARESIGRLLDILQKH